MEIEGEERKLVFKEQRCFFCGKNCPSEYLVNGVVLADKLNGIINGDGGQDKKNLIGKLCGYLKIGTESEDLLDNKLRGYESGMLLCLECEEVSCKLIKLFGELEVTQLWIRHYLTKLANKLSEERGEEDEYSYLKKLIKDKCSSKILRDPQLILQNVLKTTARHVMDLECPLEEPLVLPGSPPSPLETEEKEENDCIILDESLSSSFPQQEEIPFPSSSSPECPPPPKKKKRVVKPVHCEICHLKLASSSSLNRHMKTVHKSVKFAPLPLPLIIPPEIPPSPPPPPPFEIRIPSTITMEPCEEDDDEQAGNSYEDFEEEDHFGWASKLEGHHTHGHGQQQQVQVVRGHECPYCERVLTDTSRLRLHTSNIHTEQLLLHFKKDQVDLKHFKMICNDFLRIHRKELVMVGGSGGGGEGRRRRNFYVGCLYCNMTYSNGQYLKFHMIDEHQDLIKKELEKLQKKFLVNLAI